MMHIAGGDEKCQKQFPKLLLIEQPGPAPNRKKKWARLVKKCSPLVFGQIGTGPKAASATSILSILLHLKDSETSQSELKS